MKTAYNSQLVYCLEVIKEAKRWAKHGFITEAQRDKIAEEYKTPLYHPNFVIRLLLLLATLLALSGVTGILGLMMASAGEVGISLGCIFYGIGSFIILEKSFINNNHFKSGVTEALIYHSCLFTIGGIGGLTDFDNWHLVLISSMIVFSFAAIRYLDLITTLAAMVSLAGFVFYNCFEAGGILKQIIPFVFMILFGGIYFFVKRLKQKDDLKIWNNNLVVTEAVCLLMVYASGNYLVVRELSVQLMNLSLQEGQDIPFAYLFYFFTIAIPVWFLYNGIKSKDMVMLRVSLIVLAFSVFTFKYYFSLGHTEITLTLAGIAMIAVAIALMRYLRQPRGGFTRENLLSSRWANMNAEAFVIAQTMGGNQMHNADVTTPGGGDSGGGGSSEGF